MTRISLTLALTMLASACSNSTSGTAGGNGGSGGTGGTPVAYPLLDCDPLVPEFCGYPFPSNVYTITDAGPTGRRVAFGPQLLRGENQSGPWDASDGFSAGTPQEFGGEENIEQSLSESSPTILLDAATGKLVPHFADIDVRAPTTEEGCLIAHV